MLRTLPKRARYLQRNCGRVEAVGTHVNQSEWRRRSLLDISSAKRRRFSSANICSCERRNNRVSKSRSNALRETSAASLRFLLIMGRWCAVTVQRDVSSKCFNSRIRLSTLRLKGLPSYHFLLGNYTKAQAWSFHFSVHRKA